jgi:hypothetical protein
MAGVTMFGIEEDRLVWGRLYVEQVEEDGQDIDEAMRTITEGSQRAGDGRSEEASPTYSTLEPDASRREPTASTFPYTVRTDDAPKVRFSATVGEEPEVELAPV